MFNDTICATATSSSTGAIGIIRVSGNSALKIANKIFKGKDLEKEKSHTIHYGFIIDNNKIIDEVLVSVFLAPKTFTREDIIEINYHGSNFIQSKILDLIVKNGARMAEPGEFTKRAFLNGRIDLSQAEAVADLINSESKSTHEIAINQLKSGIWNDLKEMRQKLIHFVSLIELELDFSEEDVSFANKNDVIDLINNIIEKITPLINSFKYGNALKNGVPVVIIGKPNVGKSTLLNSLLNDERAIVSDIPGTTRDTIEEKINIDGINFRFIDTAGIRKTVDEIENYGIQRTLEKVKLAKIILFLFDKNEISPTEIVEEYNSYKNEDNEIIVCPTKFDKYLNFNWDNWLNNLKNQLINPKIIFLSSKDKSHLNNLKNALAEIVNNYKSSNQSEVIVNKRHLIELESAKASLEKAKELLIENASGDLVSIYLKQGLKNIGNLTGDIDIDKDILGTIFSSFCIGK